MSYLCDICNKAVPRQLQQRRHIVYRVIPYVRPDGIKQERTEIELEIPVCGGCDHLLHEGMPLHILRRMYAPVPDVIEEAPQKPKQLKPAQPIATLFNDTSRIRNAAKEKIEKRRTK